MEVERSGYYQYQHENKGTFFPFSSSFSERPWSYHYVIVIQNESKEDLRLHLWYHKPGSWLVGRIGNLIKARETKKIAIPDWMWWGWGGPMRRVLNHVQNLAIQYAIEDAKSTKLFYYPTPKILPWNTIVIHSDGLQSKVLPTTGLDHYEKQYGSETESWNEFVKEDHPDYNEQYLIRIINNRPFVLGADIYYPEDKGSFPMHLKKSALWSNRTLVHELRVPCGVYGTWVMKDGGHVELMIPNLAYRKNNMEMQMIGKKPLRLTVKRDRERELDDIIEGSITVSPYTQIVADEFSKVFLGLQIDVFPETVLAEIAICLEGTTILVKSNIDPCEI